MNFNVQGLLVLTCSSVSYCSSARYECVLALLLDLLLDQDQAPTIDQLRNRFIF